MREKKYQNGKWAEQETIIYYEKKGYQLKWQRKKIANIEVDLIFKNKNHYLMVEVKTAGYSLSLENYFTEKQKKRLNRAYMCLNENLSFPLCANLVIVDHQGKITCFEDILTQ